MKNRTIKYIKASKYKYVSCIEYGGEIMWRGIFYTYSFRGKKGNGKSFKTEREAAVYVDKKLIEQGKEPVNILIRKK